MKKSSLKKIGMIFGGLLATLIILIVSIPLFVNVDKYRPQLLDMANQNIQGRLELGKLHLSLWGEVRVVIESLSLLDSRNQPVLTVKDAYFHIPFLSVFSGSPALTFRMNQPNVFVTKDKAGKLNVLSLVKSSGGEKSNTGATANSANIGSSGSAGSVALPGIATRARLGIEFISALVKYKDEGTGISTELKDVNFKLKDLSLSHPIELESWADLDFQMGKTARLKGPFTLRGKAQVVLQAEKIDHVALSTELDMDAVEIMAPGLFEKKKGLSTRVALELNLSEKEVQIQKLTAKFFNLELQATGKVASDVLRLDIKSSDIPLKPWSELLPMLKEYDLAGTATLDAAISGTPMRPEYRAKLKVTSLTAKAPQLKTQPKFDVLVNVTTGQIEQILLTMTAPGNDLKVQGKVTSFSPAQAQFEVTSTSMDLDQLYNFPQSTQAKSKEESAAQNEKSSEESSSAGGSDPGQDYDAMLNPLRQNQALGSSVLKVVLNLKAMKAYDVRMSNIVCQLTWSHLAANLEHCGLKVFSGEIKTDANIQLKPKSPTYQFSAQVNGLDLGQAVESQMESFKNTVTGKAQFSIKGQGVSLNPKAAKANLKASGNMRVDQAHFVTVDISKMVADGLKEAIEKVGEKVPAAKGQKVATLPNTGSKYEFIASDFSIEGGKFMAPHFEAKALPNQGIDLKGTTTVGLIDKSLDTSWDVIDTYNLTKARDISVEQAGLKVDHLLADGGGVVHFPVKAGCTLKKPCYSYQEVASSLVKVAWANVTRAGEERAKQEVKKHTESVIKDVVPAQFQDKLKGLFR